MRGKTVVRPWGDGNAELKYWDLTSLVRSLLKELYWPEISCCSRKCTRLGGELVAFFFLL